MSKLRYVLAFVCVLLILPAMSKAPVAASPQPIAVSTETAFLDLAIPYIGKWEGLELKAYKDIVGVWTVCYGETKGVRPGDSYTKAQCDAMFARELVSYRTGTHKFFTTTTIQERLPVTRDVAYVSLSYNAGVSAVGKSTAVRRINAGDIEGGCEAIGWWNKAGGRVIRGLVNRRVEDVALCLQ